MKRVLWSLVCVACVWTIASGARADADYYEALARADAGDYLTATRLLSRALEKYPRDYALTLKLAWSQFQLSDYVAAERSYRAAIALSDGNVDAMLGLGWTLIQRDHCDEAVGILRAVLAKRPAEARAESGLRTCGERARLHGALWLALDGALYQDHPWKHSLGDVLVGLSVQPYHALSLGGAYRFLHLNPSDSRVADITQHEIYANAGYVSPAVDVLARGAWIWSSDAIANGSLHLGMSTRLRLMNDIIDELSAEATASHYQDAWIVRVAMSWRFALGPLTLTPGISTERVPNQLLMTGSANLALTLGALSLWIGARFGAEYRAAYLSQFAIFNAEDRSLWSASGGARLAFREHWSLVANYTYVSMRAPGGIACVLQVVSLAAVYVL